LQCKVYYSKITQLKPIIRLIKIANPLICIYKSIDLFKKNFTPLQALQKIKHFCSYQERCHAEVKEKLYSFGLNKSEVELLLSQLIEEDYLNEQRFAEQFAGGKFRMKQWGKIKIVYELKQKRISEYAIKKALKVIDNEEYTQLLLKLATAKWKSLSGEQYINRQVKTTNYLLQKGYEIKLIGETIAQIRSSNKD
jgi:regulatory protein